MFLYNALHTSVKLPFERLTSTCPNTFVFGQVRGPAVLVSRYLNLAQRIRDGVSDPVGRLSNIPFIKQVFSHSPVVIQGKTQTKFLPKRSKCRIAIRGSGR
jgi:hypothetical protein